MIAAVLSAIVVATIVATGLVRRFAIARMLLDVPTARSSHTTPVPRGGGLAFVLTILVALIALAACGLIDRALALAIVPAGIAIAGVGWLDDRRGLSWRVRIVVHTAAAAWILWWLGPVTVLRVGDSALALGWFAWPVSLLGLVWLANAFNFMDGIDGIAAGTAVVAGAIGAILCAAAGASGPAWLAAIIAAGALGFLPWNWAPAKIFMGDVGSVFLGLLLGAAGLSADRAGAVPATLWALLLGPFLFDATLTLIRRMARGEPWRSAHRSHAYQRAVQSGLGHGVVTSCVLVLNGVLGALVAGGVAHPPRQAASLVAGVALLGVAYFAVERRRAMTLQEPAAKA